MAETIAAQVAALEQMTLPQLQEKWGEVFGDSVVAAALLDRLLHHAIVVQIEGSSYRLREHADLLPDHLRNRPSSLHPASAETPRRRPGRPRRSSPDPENG